MTQNELEKLHQAITETEFSLALVKDDFEAADLTKLYESSKAVHTAAIGIWCAVVDILRARKGLDKREPSTDAINLEELFTEDTNAN